MIRAVWETAVGLKEVEKPPRRTRDANPPHDRRSQVAASHDGKHDRRLTEKKSGHREYAEMPLTLGQGMA